MRIDNLLFTAIVNNKTRLFFNIRRFREHRFYEKRWSPLGFYGRSKSGVV